MLMSDELTAEMDNRLEQAAALLSAGLPLEEVLANIGSDAEWLRPLLEIATEIKELQPVTPMLPPEIRSQRFLAYGEKLATASPPTNPILAGWQLLRSSLFGGWPQRLVAGLAAAGLVVILLGGLLNVAAQNSLPGQPLYPVKRTGETLRLSLTWTPEQRQQLLETFNQRRQLEIEQLLEQNEAALVAFEGNVETLTATSITIDSFIVRITPDAKISGDLAVKAYVRLEGMTHPTQGLLASAITVIRPAPPTASPPLTATAMPTSAPASAESTPTATPTTVASPDFTPTLAETPTATPTPLPALTPTASVVESTLPPPSPGDDSNDLSSGADDLDGSNDDFDDSDDDFEDSVNDFDEGDDNAGHDDNNGDDNEDDEDDDDYGDHDNGHGNDEDGCDEDNPGQGNGGSCPGDDNDQDEDDNDPDDDDGDHDSGHGNDDDGHDEDNPGGGGGYP